MGMMLGKVDGSTMIVMDVFALPVEGTETRVNAQSQAYEYMSTYVNAAKEVSLLRHCCPNVGGVIAKWLRGDCNSAVSVMSSSLLIIRIMTSP